MEIGVLLDADAHDAVDLVELAQSAENAGVGIAVIAGRRRADPWAVATWIVGVTDSIRVGTAQAEAESDSADAEAVLPAVADKAAATLSALAPERTIPPGTRWTIVDVDFDASAVRNEAVSTLPLVRIDSIAELDRITALAAAPEPESSPSGRRRSALDRAQRVPEIDYDALPAILAEGAVEPGDPEFRSVASTYLRGGNPGLVLRPRTVSEVSATIGFARKHRHLPFGIRSGGHGISGRSTNHHGLVASVAQLNTFEVLDEEHRFVRIGPGRTWKQVAHSLTPYQWALGSGDYGGVGVGGVATAGGIGLLSRKHGLTIDHLRAVELVLADGNLVRASDTENSDLFWAVRGAGANFGIATAFEFETSTVGDVGWAQLTLVSTDIEESLYRYGQLASSAPRDTTVFLVTGRAHNGQWPITLLAVVDSPDPDVVVQRLTPFLDLGVLASQQVVMTPYSGVMDMAPDVGPDGQQGFGNPVSRSAFIPTLTRQFAHEAAELLNSGLVYFFELRAMGGAIGDVGPETMAFSHRSAQFQVTAMSSSDDRLNLRWDQLRPHFHGLYLSFETDQRPERLLDAFPAPVLDRLRKLKAAYDPTNLFRDNFNITPLATASASTPARISKDVA
jgi:hypothetical protein